MSEIFDESCDPLPIEEEKKLSHLAFADDLAMFSLSKAGLQQCPNNLLIYCNNWGLEVSTKKTKVLVVNKSGKIPKEACFTIIINLLKLLTNLLTWVPLLHRMVQQGHDYMVKKN